MSVKKIVVVGGVAGGCSAAAKARRCDEDAEIILFEKGPDISYATCGLPYYLSGVISQRRKLLVTKASLFEKRFNIRVRANCEVTQIDRERRQVKYINLKDGSEATESYDRLVLAPGSNPVIPPIPGNDLPFVHVLKTLEHTDQIYNRLQNDKPESAVVIGAGLIGMETAENLAHLGIKVTVVEFMPQALTFLDPEMAEIIRRHAEQNKVAMRLAEKVTAIREENGRGVVETDQGGKIQADLVILAVGIRPNTDLAVAAGLETGATGGLKVDKHMQTSDPAIYAAGDCVESVNLITGQPGLFPMGAAANKQGRAAGANVVGGQLAVKGFCGTVIVKVFKLTAAKTGLSEKEALAAGFTPFVSYILAPHHAGYYPGAKEIRIKTITERESGQLLGAQVIGQKGVDKRIDVLATAIYNKMNIEELMDLDLAYAPPFSSARDPIFVSGAVGQNFYQGAWEPITPYDLNERIKAGDNCIILDVRTKKELEKTGLIPGAIHIPIDDLRDRLAELDREREIIVYCAIGLRSYLGFRILKMKGFKDIKSLTGGIGCWTYQLESYKTP